MKRGIVFYEKIGFGDSARGVVASSSNYTATPNLNGNAAGNISSATRNTLSFDITTKGDYVIQFKEVGSGLVLGI